MAKKAAKHGGVETEPVVPFVDVPPAPTSIADELKKLAGFRDADVLTEEEFVAQKEVMLGRYR